MSAVERRYNNHELLTDIFNTPKDGVEQYGKKIMVIFCKKKSNNLQ